MLFIIILILGMRKLSLQFQVKQLSLSIQLVGAWHLNSGLSGLRPMIFPP